MEDQRRKTQAKQCSDTAPVRNTPSTAGNSMTSSERPSPEPLLKKEASQAVLGGENILETLWKPSNALNYRVWGIPAVLSREIPGNALRAFPGSFRNFSGISSGKSQPQGVWPTQNSPKEAPQSSYAPQNLVLPPPPAKGPNEEKLYKSVENS